jgi:cytochrome b involved in lipid metabolism
MGCAVCKPRDGSSHEITTFQQLEDEITKGRKLIVYENAVIDVASFMVEHPGGPTIMEPYIGKRLQ